MLFRSILDLCTGTGTNAVNIAKKNAGVKIVGVDISKNMLAVAKSKLKKEKLLNIEFLLMDASDMSFENECFDKVLLSLVLHEIDEGLAAKIISEAIRVLKPNGASWYMLPLGFLIMIPFVGIAEEAGWRGFLQPEFEKKLPFPLSVLAVAAIWDVWHLDLWFDPTSNHYGDSFIGFSINILLWLYAERREKETIKIEQTEPKKNIRED